MKTFEQFVNEKPNGYDLYRCENVMEINFLNLMVRRSLRFPGVFIIDYVSLPYPYRTLGILTSFLDKWEPRVPLAMGRFHKNVYFRSFMENNRKWHLYDLHGEDFLYTDLSSKIIDQ